jgi:hypothetical protein
MKRLLLITALAGLAIASFATLAWARGGYGYGYGYGNGYSHRGGPCCGRGPCATMSDWAPYRNYDPATVESIHGKVVKVETVSGRGWYGGVHLMVKTDKETLPVHLGPSWYLSNKDISFKEGDKVEVHGSRITYDHEPALIADHVTQSGHTLKLRDSDGIPLWSGRNRAY